MPVAGIVVCFAYDKKKNGSDLIRNIFNALDNMKFLGTTKTQTKFPKDFLKNQPTFSSFELIKSRENSIKQTINNGLSVTYIVQSIIPYVSYELYILCASKFKTPKINFNSELEVIMLYGHIKQIPTNDFSNSNKFLETMFGILPTINPIYAWGDDWRFIEKMEGKDPRQFIWGINYWNKELSEKIGINNISQLDSDVWNVRTHLTGGISLSAAPLPFAAPQAQKNKTAKHLNITEKLKDVLIIGPEVKKQVAKDDFW